MKKLLAFISVICLMIGPASACADTIETTPYATTITCDQLIAGEQYVFMAIAGSSNNYTVDANSVRCIQQFVAAGSSVQIALIGERPNPEVYLFGGRFSSSGSPRILQLSDHSVHTPSVFPKDLIFIENEAFINCAFEYVYLSYGVASIGSGAFKNCSSLKYIFIPSSVMSIADDAFAGCADDLVIGCAEGSFAYHYALSNNYSIEAR